MPIYGASSVVKTARVTLDAAALFASATTPAELVPAVAGYTVAPLAIVYAFACVTPNASGVVQFAVNRTNSGAALGEGNVDFSAENSVTTLSLTPVGDVAETTIDGGFGLSIAYQNDPLAVPATGAMTITVYYISVPTAVL